MTRVELGRYVLTSDEGCWTVSVKRKAGKGRNKGKMVEDVYGYYGRLPQALSGLLDLELRSCDAKSIEELAEKLKEFREELKPLMKL